MLDVRTDIDQRLARVQAALRAQQLDALVIFFGGQHTMLRMDQVMYLTDFRTLECAILIVSPAGRPHLIIAPEWDGDRARATAAGVEVTAIPAARVVTTAARLSRSFPGRVALAGRTQMPVADFEAFAAGFGREVTDGESIVPQIGATRTPVELERVERAAAIADEGFRTLCETACVGMREYELAAEVEAAMQAAGAEDNFGLIGAGKHNLAVRPPTDRRLEAGDVIVGEITPCYRGYLAQICRSFVLGEPTEAQRHAYAMLLDALHAGYDAARPGRPSADIARAINGVIGAAGFEEYCRPPYMRTRGHGLGLGGVVPYDITDRAGPTLEANMTMVIHPNQYLPETGYLMCGDTVVIEAQGPRPLTRTDQRLFWKAV